MKKFLPLLFAIVALPLFQSCVGPGNYGSSYGTATNYGSSVGIISTSHSRWGYDPYYRSYYDYSLGQYYDLNRGRYYTTLPRRYSSPFYPSYYSRGSTLRAPSRLPYLTSSYSRPSVGFARTGNSRWAYDPYRRSYYDNQQKRYYNTSSGKYYNSMPKRYSNPSYPSGHRSGQNVQLNSRLPYVSNRNSSSQRTRNDNQRPSRETRTVVTRVSLGKAQAIAQREEAHSHLLSRGVPPAAIQPALREPHRDHKAVPSLHKGHKVVPKLHKDFKPASDFTKTAKPSPDFTETTKPSSDFTETQSRPQTTKPSPDFTENTKSVLRLPKEHKAVRSLPRTAVLPKVAVTIELRRKEGGRKSSSQNFLIFPKIPKEAAAPCRSAAFLWPKTNA